jgi:hypothetical protein
MICAPRCNQRSNAKAQERWLFAIGRLTSSTGLPGESIRRRGDHLDRVGIEGGPSDTETRQEGRGTLSFLCSSRSHRTRLSGSPDLLANEIPQDGLRQTLASHGCRLRGSPGGR